LSNKKDSNFYLLFISKNMKPLFTTKEFKNTKSEDKLPCECYECNKSFYKKKKYILAFMNKKGSDSIQFCNIKCRSSFKSKQKEVICKNCNKTFNKSLSQLKRTKSNFCSSSCSAAYNNKHKTHGTRRSKLEIYLEEQLIKLYPKIDFHFNRKDIINSELDIYIPSIKLAFELNGIFHYKPIFGPEKLKKIQNNDQRKFQACLEHNIELVLINSSLLTYFKSKNAEKYLNIITEVLNKKI